ncbi:unnamed protein product [Ilex paraguariensis]|uniref:Uncharacterized protein n=1 Tax=Ilex paraguariensis TaxID=185542 RepID=A0ABC8QN71_9AQUA
MAIDWKSFSVDETNQHNQYPSGMALHNIMSFFVTITGSCEDIFCSGMVEAFAPKRFCPAMLEALLLDLIRSWTDGSFCIILVYVCVLFCYGKVFWPFLCFL